MSYNCSPADDNGAIGAHREAVPACFGTTYFYVDMLVRLVGNQRKEMAKYCEEISGMMRREVEAAARSKHPEANLQKLGDKKDIENFHSTFERIAKQQE